MLTRDRVVAEALAITSATDAAALSMRTLATRLGVVPAALDRHVRSKEQLYDVILDGALAGVDCQADPAPGPDRSPRSRLAFRLIYNHAIGFARSSRSPGNPGQHWQSSTITWRHCPAHPPQPRPRRERQ